MAERLRALEYVLSPRHPRWDCNYNLTVWVYLKVRKRHVKSAHAIWLALPTSPTPSTFHVQLPSAEGVRVCVWGGDVPVCVRVCVRVHACTFHKVYTKTKHLG